MAKPEGTGKKKTQKETSSPASRRLVEELLIFLSLINHIKGSSGCLLYK